MVVLARKTVLWGARTSQNKAGREDGEVEAIAWAGSTELPLALGNVGEKQDKVSLQAAFPLGYYPCPAGNSPIPVSVWVIQRN